MDTPKNSSTNPVLGILKSRNTIYTLVAIAIFAAISWAFFYPDDVMGNVLQQHDMQQGYANGQEAKAFAEKTGETTRWTNSLFSGMPTFQITPSYDSSKLIQWINSVYSLGFPSPVNLIFMMMVGFYILLIAFDMKWYVAILGALGYGFSSYFFILIGAGHIWKFVTLAYIPPTIAGIVWCYRGRYFTGATIAALFATLQIAANHVQMTYYFLFVILGMVIAYLIIAIKNKEIRKWTTSTYSLAIAAILAVGANAPNLYNTYKYGKETMRGGHSELTAPNQNTSAKGLDKDYITAWSYGIDETASLLIPNVKGGATIRPQAGDNKLMSLAETQKAQDMLSKGEISNEEYQYLAQFPQYFGDQPMTNGPVYVGAIIFVLFLIGCVIVKGPMKWVLLALTIFSIFLSWGHNMMWLTDWFIDYFPMYNKFRTVASILVIAEFTMPLLAVLALNKILTEENAAAKYHKVIFGAFGITGFICLVVYLAPNMFGAFSQQETQQYILTGVSQQVPTLFNAVESIRYDLVKADAMRSLIFLIMGFAALLLFLTKKLNATYTGAIIAVILLVDMYSVNKRYISTSSFTSPLPMDQKIAERPVDRQILQDTAMNYRVLDVNNFTNAGPSYYHKCIGGYHAAKLSRYQDLIDRQIARNNFQVLNMLNTRYIITSDSVVERNPEALGNAWFVDTLEYVKTPDQEMAYLNKFNPKTQAVADAKFETALGKAKMVTPGDTIFETSYAPNELTYHASSKNGGIAVFSEVYFPWGWKATIDGENVEIGRVNYVLRAINIPAGNHTIHFKFDPQSVNTADYIATIAIIIIYLALIAAVGVSFLRYMKKNKMIEDIDD